MCALTSSKIKISTKILRLNPGQFLLLSGLRANLSHRIGTRPLSAISPLSAFQLVARRLSLTVRTESRMKRQRDTSQALQYKDKSISNHASADSQSTLPSASQAATAPKSLAQRLGLPLNTATTTTQSPPSKKQKKIHSGTPPLESAKTNMSSMWGAKGPNRSGASQAPPVYNTYNSTRQQQQGGSAGVGRTKAPAVSGPIYNQKYIMSTFEASAGRGNHQHAQQTAKYLENPKAVINNYMTALGEPVKYVGGKVNNTGPAMFR